MRNFRELTNSAAVNSAMNEFDKIGQDAFLRKYGFRRARGYYVVRDGKRYDSKAIVGAAYGYQFPSLGPLRPSDFVGGNKTVAPLLSEMGFKVVIDKQTGKDRSHRR